MLRIAFFVIFSFCSVISAFTQSTISTPTKVSKENCKDLSDQFTDYQIYEFATSKLYESLSKTESLQKLAINFENKEIQADLWEDEALTSQIETYSSSQGLMNVFYPKAYRGYVESSGKSIRLSIKDDFLYGYFTSTEGVEYIEPLHYFDPNASKNQYVIYKSSDVIPILGKTCAVTEAQKISSNDNANKSAAVGECFILELAIASDDLMFVEYGSVPAVVAHNVGVMNNVQGNYDDEFADEIQYAIVEQFVVDDGNDPWTDSTIPGTLLNSFTTWGPTGFSNTHDLGQIWTDRDLDGSTIGIAWIGVVCASFRYHVLQDFSTNADFLRVLTSHEIGHNFNANHDPSGSPHIMAPTVQNTTTWSTISINDINAHISSRTCLATCGPPVADFTASVTSVCIGGTVQFYDMSSGSPNSWVWSFPGGSPSSSTLENPAVQYTTPGTYSVTLTATNPDGSDMETKTGYITVNATGSDFVLSESFNNPIDWLQSNPDGNTLWSLIIVNGDTMAYFNNYGNNEQGDIDGLISPTLNFQNYSFYTLEFEYAYARYSANRSDILRIQISTDGGDNYTTIFTGEEFGNGNWATAPDQTSEFFPFSTSEWCSGTTYGPSCLSLDLSSYAGLSEVVIRFENENDFGNNIFIDDVKIVGSCNMPMNENVVINEFHYQNTGTDVNEFIEIFHNSTAPLNNPAQYEIAIYNGTTVQESISLDQLTPTSGNGGYFYVWEPTQLPNTLGGISVCGPGGVADFVSYEGVITATDGCAAGEQSNDVSVSENSSAAVGSAIQLIDGSWLVTNGYNTKEIVNTDYVIYKEQQDICEENAIGTPVQGNEFVFIGVPEGIVAAINPNNQNLGIVTSSVYRSSTPREDNDGTNYLDRTVYLEPSFNPASPVTVRLYFTTSELQNLISDSSGDPDEVNSISDLVITKVSNLDCSSEFFGPGELIPVTNTGNDAIGQYVEISISSFSAFFAHGGAAPLPVELLFFEAEKLEDDVMLTWETASERNNSHFEIQRSDNGKNFYSLGIVQGNGTSSDVNSYEFFDQKTDSPIHYYRLKQVDFDGKYEYTDVRRVTFQSNVQVHFQLNPTIVRNEIEFTAIQKNIEYQFAIYNQMGQIVKEGSFTNQTLLNLESIGSGMYIVQLFGRTRTPIFTKKIIKL